MLSVVMLGLAFSMQSVVMLNVVMLNVVAPFAGVASSFFHKYKTWLKL
jgi:hypothetical protein